ncbi:hypothetical protein B1992_00085 [Pseudoxanthomonas broegbernensis]|uniref:Uncharacterized protein n=1 Tax=Pseudoxanthomonas broegbernensis TaxID=83619 RepID=A0A7V8K815_9GAMM|nr:phage tail protein [Pseudoxanthomonas broegbernensis]KAF1687889.1 hypothetical protein B1992_00085 [Pseudoxanthomonas broegbernensis]MBB6064880.1 hypothetical protein [Pseudoxanthomonas broegbernensis]
MNDVAQIVTSGYLRYLPSVFAKADNGFVAGYLKIFEKLLTGLNDDTLDGRRGIQELLAAGVVGNLFYSRFSFLFPAGDEQFIPPISGLPQEQRDVLLTLFNSYIGVPKRPDPLANHVAARSGDDDLEAFTVWLNEFLGWLASWVDLVLDQAWSLDKKRTVIAQIMALYRLRGTAQGMSMLLNLMLDLPWAEVECYQPGSSAPVKIGQLSVNVFNPSPPPIVVNGRADVPGTFVLHASYQPGFPLVSGYAPWLFVVQVLLPAKVDTDLVLAPAGAQKVQWLFGQLAILLDALKPATSRYQWQIQGGMCLRADDTGLSAECPRPRAPQLNINAVLGTRMPS